MIPLTSDSSREALVALHQQALALGPDEDFIFDGAGVSSIPGASVQILVSAAMTAFGRGKKCIIRNVTDELMKYFDQFGIDWRLAQIEIEQEGNRE